MNFKATSDELTSASVSLKDCCFYDTGTTDSNSVYWDNGRFNKTVNDTGTLLECKANNTWASLVPIQQGQSFKIPFKIELTVLEVNSCRVQFNNINNAEKRFYITTTGEHTIVVKNDGVFFNGVNMNIGEPTSNSSVFMLQLADENKYVKFKDLLIYNGE